MSRLKVPSLQHLARNWHDSPERIHDALVRLADNSPVFSYESIYKLIRDQLVYNVPEHQLVECIRRAEKRENIRRTLLEVQRLVSAHFTAIEPSFVHVVTPRHYPIGKGLLVPFKPPIIYGVSGQVFFPWFSFWRTNPLSDERLSLFASMVGDMLDQDPDLEDVVFQVLDFSAATPRDDRTLTVIDAREIPRLKQARKSEMLEVFAEGFMRAQATLANRPEVARDSARAEQSSDEIQLPIWDS